MNSTAEKIWQQVLEKAQKKIDERSFDLWLSQTKGVDYSTDTIFIEVPNQFYAERLLGKFGAELKKCTQEVMGKNFKIECRISDLPNERPTSAPEQELYKQPPQPQTPSKSKSKSTSQKSSGTDFGESLLNQKYVFSRFVVGKNNQFASAAAMAVAEKPAQVYNPLFIYGGVGLGKTHLMQAIGHRVKEKFPKSKIYYVPAETFMNEMINSIQYSNIMAFRNKYRGVDLLLIDDIQFLAGKESTQEEFFHTFNALHSAHKQIVITSDRPPKDIPTLEERLVSRFEWGLITDIQPPDLETRIAILRKKAEENNVPIPDNVIIFIANNVTSNIRELEGSLIRLTAYASMKNTEITTELAAEVLQNMFGGQKKPLLTIEIIQRAVADHFGVTIEQLKSPKRKKYIANARQIAMYLARELTETPLADIGQSFGGRGHATVIHAHDKVKKELRANEDDAVKAVDTISNSLKDWISVWKK